MLRRTRSTALAALVVGLLALAGCATEPAATPTSGPLEVDAAWLDGGRLIALTTWGSSTCVPMAEAATVEGDALEVTLVDADPDAACTTDYLQRATIVGVPEGVDPAADLAITATYLDAVGETTLAGVDGLAGPGTETDYAPSAGRIDDSGTFAFLTWGSSSCAPVIESVETADAVVTVTFETPPADRACTMDMAPRVALAVAEGGTATEVVFQGDTFDGIRVPIVG